MTDSRKKRILDRLKADLIEAVGATGVEIMELDDDKAIFGPGTTLELDSLDAMELVLLLETHFGIKIKGDTGTRQIFKSFNKVGDHILEFGDPEKVQAYLGSVKK